MIRRTLTALASVSVLAACSAAPTEDAALATEDGIQTGSYNDLNLAAGSMVLYEVQARAANACDPDVGSAAQRAACRAKIAPTVTYRAEGMTCAERPALEKIRLGTLEDMLEDTADFREGITLRYVKEKVGANTVWLMPLFPNNDAWAIPDACDNLGSPYAVRDYMHVAASLSRACITEGRDESSAAPCWGNASLDALIQQAHARGVKIMLDVALNHFGHNYAMYDYADFTPVRDRLARGESPERLWDFGATYEEGLVRPEILDTVEELEAVAARSPQRRADLDALSRKCPALSGDALVRAFNAYRVALDWERERFACGGAYLEYQAPGFYLGKNAWDPSTGVGSNFTNNWRDVKFLYHKEENAAHMHEFVREREYMFRIMNYWVSRGVDGFRLDHTTDADSGIGPNEWKYLTTKVNYYAAKRGQAKPVYLAEEFHDQMGMNKVVDVMTEGYVGDMTARGGTTKDSGHVERVLNNMSRFGGHAFVMTALETHDEHRLTDKTGFNVWTGAGFWGIGAAQRATPMILMGQELGESYGLAFRKSDYLRARFEGAPNYRRDADALAGYYKAFNTARLDPANRALLAPNYVFLRSRWNGYGDSRILAQAKWSDDGNVVFVFHNLWEQSVAQNFYISPDAAAAMRIRDDLRYKLVDVIAGQQAGGCRTGGELKSDFYVAMGGGTRAQWLRLERCN